MEDFPAFPRAQVFGRFDPEVIEERRKAAEDMLHFTVHIPALNNSPQLKEFFRPVEHLPIHSFPSDPASTATSLSHGEGLASLEASGTKPEVLLSADPTQKPEVESASLDPGRYLPQATERIRQAVLCEASRDFQGAFHGYRTGVDLLLQGLQGRLSDPNPARREAVKKKTAEYLQRAEEIFQQHLKHLEL
ncbi:Sorting nexin-15, partial [Ophiophagus hannah]